MTADKKAQVVGLGHIAVYVSDIARSVAFYKLLGFEETHFFARPNGNQISFVQCGSCILELICPTDKTLVGRGAGVVDHICVEVTDMEATVEKMRANGAIGEGASKISCTDMFGGAKNFFFPGPDGERIEFFDYMK